MFGGQSNGPGSQGSKNPYASSQTSKSLSATFSSQNTTSGSSWQNRGTVANTNSNTFGSPAPAFGGGFAKNAGSFGAISASQPSTGFGSISTPGSSSSTSSAQVGSSTGWRSTSPGTFNLSKSPATHGFGASNPSTSFAPSSAQHTYKCRMCQAVFPSSEELKRHIKAEGHFDTSRAAPPATGGPSTGFGSSFGSSNAPFGGAAKPHSQFGDVPPPQTGFGASTAGSGPFFGGTPQTFGTNPFDSRPGSTRRSPSRFSDADAPNPPAPQQQSQPWSRAPPSQDFRSQPPSAQAAAHRARDYSGVHSSPPRRFPGQSAAPSDQDYSQQPQSSQSSPPLQPRGPPPPQDYRSMYSQQSSAPRSEAYQPTRPRPSFGQPSQASLAKMGPPLGQSQSSYGPGGGFGGSNRPAFEAGGASGAGRAFDPRRNAPRSFPAPSANTQTATASAHKPVIPVTPLAAAPDQDKDITPLSTASDDASLVSGDEGDHASDADYNPADDQGTGTADDNDDEDDDEEEDDLNYSQESAAELIHSAHSSPVKSPGLGSPAAAARSRAEGLPQRALFGQTSGSAPNTVRSLAGAAPAAGAQSGATSSLMGFMKTSSKFPAAAQQQQAPPAVQASHSQYAHSSGGSAHGSDSESVSSDGTDAMGTCEDMCPPEERQKRQNESDIHKLEIPHADMTPGRPDFALTMVKKFQRSSADHALQIPHLLRTPDALLRTIEYIENELMDRAAAGVFDPRIGEAPTTLFIYLFVWDRYRMVAKDFTLQQSVLPLSRVWVECHERMARWFILMDHKMQAADDFISAGHGQQNGEQLNNLLKTLHGYYFRSRTVTDASTAPTSSNTPSSTPAVIDMPNKAEFVCYFVIFQLGNGGEVSKYLQQLPDEILNSEQVRFAIEVWGALKTQNYAKYFRLLRTRATLLQACLMHRYVGEVRLTALKKLTRSLNPPGSKPQEYLLGDLMRLFMFESVPEAAEFIEHCGLTLCPGSASGLNPGTSSPPTEDFVVLLSGQNIDHLLPRDKNDRAIMPSTSYMGHAIDRVKALKPGSTSVCHSIAEVCRGFATGGSSPIFAPAARTGPAPAGGAVKSDFGMRVPMVKGVSPATVPAGISSAFADKAAADAKKKLLSQGLSARGPKAAASPIPPMTDEDVWGGTQRFYPKEDTGPGSGYNISKKKEDTAKRASPFGGSASTSGSESSTAGSSWGGKTPVAPAAGVAGSAGGWGSDATKTGGAFGVASSPAFGSTTGPSSGSSQDSWRRSAPSAARDAPKEGSFGGSSGKGQQGQGQGQSQGQQGQGQQVRSLNADAPAFPAVPGSALSADNKPSFPTQRPAATSFGAPGPEKVNPFSSAAAPVKTAADPAPALAFGSVRSPAALPPFGSVPSPAAPVVAPPTLSAAISSFAAPAPVAAPVPAPSSVSTAAAAPREPTLAQIGAFLNTRFTPGPALNPNSAPFVPAGRKEPEAPAPSASTTAPAPATVDPATKQKETAHNVFGDGPKASATSFAAPPVKTATPVSASLIPEPDKEGRTVNQAKLTAFEAKVKRNEGVRAQKSVLANWRSQAQEAQAQRTKRTAALYLLFWKQSHRRGLRARESFLSDIKSIKIVDPLVQGLGGLNIFGASEGSLEAKSSGSNVLKRKQAQSAETERQLNAIAETEAQVRYSLLCDVGCDVATTSVTSSTSTGESEVVQRSRGAKSLLDVVARTLKAAKTCQLRTLLGLPVADSTQQALAHADAPPTEDGPVYSGALTFKLAMVSECSVAGVACKHSEGKVCSCGGLSNSLRAVLANERGYGYTVSSDAPGQQSHMSKAQLGKMKKRRGMLARALATTASPARVVRVGLHSHALDAATTLHLSVLDTCGLGSTTTNTTNTSALTSSQVEAVSDLTGVQGAVIVIHPHSGARVVAVLNQLLHCAQERIPVVLVLFNPQHPSQSVEELSPADLLRTTSPSASCLAARKTLQDLKTLLYPSRPEWLDSVQGCIVLNGVTQDSPSGARAVMARALQLLAASAAPTPAVARVIPADWLMRQIHAPVASEVQRNSAFASSSGELSEQQLRGLCHEALAGAIDQANARLSQVAASLREVQASAEVHTGKFPAFDSLQGSGYLPAGVLALSALRPTTAEKESESDLFLPSNWLEVSRLSRAAQLVDSMRFPQWSSSDSIADYQAQLLNFPSGAASGGKRMCAKGFVAALEDILNSAYSSKQAAHLPGAIEKVLEDIIRERLRCLPDGALPAYMYLPLTKPGSLRELLQPAPMLGDGDAADSASANANAGTEHHSSEQDDDVMMSPAGGAYFEQSQYAQACPTGFGRSLFAQFSRDSVLHGASFSSPSTDHKTKRAFDTDSTDADEYVRAHERRASSESMDWRSSSAASDHAHASATTDSAHKRAKFSGQDIDGAESGAAATPSSTKFGIAYEKLFGGNKSPTPSTPATSSATPSGQSVLSTDPHTRALQSELHREQAAAERLTSMLQSALSPVRSPLGVSRAPATPGTTSANGGNGGNSSMSTTQPSSESKQAMEDPMQFIEQCRRERERFNSVVSL